MGLNITKLQDTSPESNPLYFIDANIWIAILKNNQYGQAQKNYKPYIDFFEAIVNLNSITDIKVSKKLPNIPKIVFTSMLLSEIINAYLRNVAMPAFLNNTPGDFKKDYRENVHSDYDKQIKILVSDIQEYSFLFHLVDDCFSILKPIDNLNNLSRSIDYNDLYYCSLMQHLNVPIITHDGDFKFEGIRILTTNFLLLRIM